MDLSVNNTKYNINLQTYKTTAKPKLSTTLPVSTNSITKLPSLAQSSHLIPFGQKSYLDGKDFMLPKKFKPDNYQIQAGKALRRGENVIVTAPTGTGKTAIANFAINDNFKNKKRTFYTTPLKALSNQKYRDLQKMFGKENVGILTGDKKENAQAPIIVMTTEIYRNMVASNFYEKHNDQLNNLQTVVFDEFHYMNDNDRGSVWEESIMFTPNKTQILALSATVGNNESITKWIQNKSEKTTTLIDASKNKRAVELNFKIEKSFVSQNDEELSTKHKHIKPRKGKSARFSIKDDKKEAAFVSARSILTEIFDLKKGDKLPAITFVFSKKFAEELIKESEKKGLDLTSKEDKKEIKRLLKEYKQNKQLYTKNLNEKALLKGYAIHSAAILPTQKEFVEELFNKKLIKVVYATETLAAGINMPARSVILTDVEKPSTGPTGEKTRRNLTPNEFHQMCGRAGRRGIDKTGYVYLMAANPDKAKNFEMLVGSAPDKIESKLKIDASSVTGLYLRTPKRENMEQILNMSFLVHNQKEKTKERVVKEQMEVFDAYSKLLTTYDCIEDVQEGHRTTEKGELINAIKGRPQIPILQTILNKTFDSIEPEDFAGIASAMALSPKNNKTEKSTKSTLSSELTRIGIQIDNLISSFPNADTSKINHNNSTNDILNYTAKRASTIVDTKYGDSLFEQPEVELVIRLEELQQLLDEVETEESLMGSSPDLEIKYNRVTKEFNKISQVLSLKKAQDKLIGTLNYRDSITPKNGLNNTLKLEKIFDEVSEEYERYNALVKGVDRTGCIPQAQLNQQAMPIIRKWAKLNALSNDYETNWEKITEEIKAEPTIKYEGDFFNAVAQTIDFINQIDALAHKAIPMCRGKEVQYLSNLRETCQKAVKLLKQPPLYNAEELKAQETEPEG